MLKDLKLIAVSKCVQSNYSLTPNRLNILEAMQSYSKPVSAYALQAGLIESGRKYNIATIYRVIDFWITIGIIHKIASVNKFILCNSPHEKHTHITNFCKSCERIFESCSKRMGIDLKKGSESMGLTLLPETHLEVSVLCEKCN